jgi:hypothetical protein
MPVDYDGDLYAKLWDVFTRPMTVTPVVSQPTAPAYLSRCYYDTRGLDVLTEDGAVLSDSKVYIDIRIAEFAVLPMQGDYIDIPFAVGVPGGSYVVEDSEGDGNAGGIINITLRKRVTNKPAAFP